MRTRGDLSVLSSVVRETLGICHKASSNHEHLQAAMNWLCTAQDATPDDGISGFYDAAAGTWAPSYPETTGYIIPTFFDYAAYAKCYDYRDRAIRMADWLLTLQLDNGAFPMGPLWSDLECKPIVFDTGQVIHGLIRVFEETSDSKYIEAAKRAGDWLVEIQGSDGNWRKHTFLDHPHTYNARVAWALLRLNIASQDDRYRLAAVRNLQWTMAQQTPDGWFHNAAFRPHEEPLTHTLAYTICGLLESGRLLSNQHMVDAARLSANALLSEQVKKGYLQGKFGYAWQSSVKWSCLTGDVQMALIWLKFYEMTGDKSYIKAATEANRYVKRTQCLNGGLIGIRGAIAGSFPIYGDYHPYLYVNWAAKFFVDSLLLEERLRTEGEMS